MLNLSRLCFIGGYTIVTKMLQGFQEQLSRMGSLKGHRVQNGSTVDASTDLP